MERATSFVFLNEGGKARKTPVKIGFNDGVNVEIVSGLAESAKVITAGKTVLVDGQPVNTGAGK